MKTQTTEKAQSTQKLNDLNFRSFKKNPSKEKEITSLELIVERQDDLYWGRIENHGFMPTGQGDTIKSLIKNVKDSIEDYVSHEGKNDKYWNKFKLDHVEFNILYDMQALFEQFEFLKISSIS